jgi:hypothetical protein
MTRRPKAAKATCFILKVSMLNGAAILCPKATIAISKGEFEAGRLKIGESGNTT